MFWQVGRELGLEGPDPISPNPSILLFPPLSCQHHKNVLRSKKCMVCLWLSSVIFFRGLQPLLKSLLCGFNSPIRFQLFSKNRAFFVVLLIDINFENPILFVGGP